MAMNNGSKFGLILLAITIVIIGFIDVTSDKKIDWTRTYNQRDKIPYGLYFVRQELSNILGDSVVIEDFTSTHYSALRTFLKGKEDGSIVYVVDQFYEGKEVSKELLEYVERGGEVFISSNTIPYALLDTLQIRQDYYYPENFEDVVDIENRPFLLNDGKNAFYKDLEYPGLFYDLDSAAVRIIGCFEIGKKEIPDFVEVKRKKGRFLLHLEPLMFTNYYMVQKRNFIYGSASLKLLSRNKVYWYDGFSEDKKARTPLRVLLLNDGLRQSWYILLFVLLLFLLFKSKREQRAVKVLYQEPNLSKEFARTIASLYYESGNPGNLAQKKVEYFLYELRMYFQLDILKLEEVDFPKQLSSKSAVSVEQCVHLVDLLIRYRAATAATDQELVQLNNEIEEFKINANIL
ncbi:DUF4350 domain-containing protein [Sphingobacterium sp. LRF_L2]|uniref:DUF4350 domain-containing protein n=1 Tax=Sphingobacterium sp. LRF_L2 TaxID=3369421 RepID=UPI003F62F982